MSKWEGPVTTEAMYQCPDCGQAYSSIARADRLDSCRLDGCEGQPKRVWKYTNFTKVPGGGRG